MNIDINLKSIEAFKNISDSAISIINNEAVYQKYKIGEAILRGDIIPNKIKIVLSGEARFVDLSKDKPTTIYKLGPDSFIGLSSILNVNPCEAITASTDLFCLVLTDKLILDLYEKEKEFRNWCDRKVQIADSYQVALNINNKLAKTQFSNKELSYKLLNNINILTIKNSDKLSLAQDSIGIIGSGNIVDRQIGESVDKDSVLNIREPLPARIYEINQKLYEDITKKNLINNKENDSRKAINDSTINITQDKSIDQTAESIGQYIEKKDFKLIKAKGILRESLACIQMITQNLGLPYRLDSIEKILRQSVSRGIDPTLQLLANILAGMGVYTYVTKVNQTTIFRLPTPSLIKWGSSFAVIKETNSNFIELASPTDGIFQITLDEFKDLFTEDVIEIIWVDKHTETPEAKFSLQWLLPAINRHRNVLIQVLIASFVVQLIGLINPLMIQVIIDKVISQRSLDTLQILGIGLIVVTILGGVLSSLRTFLFTETTNRIDTRLGAEVIDHLLRLPLNFFDKRPVGELGSRVAELEKIRNFLTGQALTTILDASFSLIYIIVMVVYSWLLTIIALGVVPIQILLTLIGAPLIRRQIREVAEENAKTQSHLVEVLTGVQTVKAQNIENVSRWKWQELYGQYISKSFQKTITGSVLGETSKVLQQLSQLLVLWVGATLVLDGQLTLGQLIAFRIIAGYVTQPLLRLSSIWQNIQELKVSFERLGDIIDNPAETTDIDRGKIPLPSIKGSVEFENVSFKFINSQPNVLNDINLKITPGQFVGIVGQSGSGKSSLMKLLPRLYSPRKGRILIDDYDINKVELYSLRRQIGIVPQEPLLFAGTVNENIALTNPDSPSDEIIKAAKNSAAHEFIMTLQDGYNTKIGERGAGLSGGQKQRIAIARTLLSNPKLLIMDEATSALDYQTERKVCEGLRSTCKGSTVFFITHRLSTVRNADIIIMLHEGAIEEIGTHEELINKKGRYFALYRQQESS